MNMGHSLSHYILVGTVIVSVASLVLICLLSAPKIAEVMGPIGMNVVTRVMGLILASFAVEFMAKGMTELFPVLVSGLV
jgi:multiple antibiotic resistance protein